MGFNKETFLNEAIKEVERLDKLNKKARLQGKRSKAKFNYNKFCNKYGFSPEGYGFIDMFYGQILLFQMNEMFSSDEKESIIEIVYKAFESTKHMIINELGVAI
jgi:hypothetical protein